MFSAPGRTRRPAHPGRCPRDLEARSANGSCRDISNASWPKTFSRGNRTSSTFTRSTYLRTLRWRPISQAGIPYCVTVHGGLFPAALRRGRLKKTLFHVLFERSYLNEARFIHAVSPHETAAIRRRRESAHRDGAEWPSARQQRSRIPTGRAVCRESLASRTDGCSCSSADWTLGKGTGSVDQGVRAGRLRDAGLVLVGPDWGARERHWRRSPDGSGSRPARVHRPGIR